MTLVKRVRNFLLDQDYYVDFYDQFVHVYQYQDILELKEERICLQMASFQLLFLGKDFTIKQLEKHELLFQGVLESMQILR